MRPQVLTSTLLSASRLYTTSASSTCASSPATRTLLPSIKNTCAAPTINARLFSTTFAHNKTVKPQAETTNSKQNIRIPTPSTPITAKTTTMAASSSQLLEAFKARRSYYQLTKDLPIPKDKITDIVQEALIQIPSSFNSQSNRVLVLFGEEHDKLWDITSSILKPLVPAENWSATEARNNGFRNAAGTVLTFVDTTVVSDFQEKFALYKDRFPTWAEHSTAMLQFAVWTTLEAEGLGANLQHYNPLIDERVAAEWKIPATWQLTAQVVFGGRGGEAGPKTHKPLEETFKVAGV
ncbi:Nitroreductase-like protein [Poronia punctata]|nr:Nitroreductase-like protein [Poronia punctata]